LSCQLFLSDFPCSALLQKAGAAAASIIHEPGALRQFA